MSKKNYVLRTVGIIWRESPLRLLLCILLLVIASLFSPIYLYAADRLITQLQIVDITAREVYADVLFFVFALLLNNSKALINLLGSYLWITAEIALQSALIKKAAQHPLIHYDTPCLYERIEKAMGSYGNAVGTVMMLISAVFISAFSAAVICGYLSSVNLVFAVVLLLAMGFKALSYRFASKNLRSMRTLQAKEKAKMDAFEQHTWHKETRAFGAVEHFLTKWEEVNAQYHEREYRTEAKNLAMSGAQDMLTYLAYAAAIGVAMVGQKAAGGVQIGSLIVLFLAMESIYSSMDTVVMQVGNVLQNASLSSELFEFIDDPNELLYEKELTAQASIELENVSFTYPYAQQEALRGITLSIKKGEHIALVGPNGSGKSTLVKLLSGLYVPTKGKIRWGADMDLDIRSGTNVSAVFQDVQTYNMTLGENIAISSVEHQGDKRQIVTSLERAFGMNWLSKYEHGVDTLVGTQFGGVDLSGGEKQRLAIARAYFRPYTLIFLDEPSSAMDALSEKRLYEDFLSISRGKTSVYITHRLSSVRLADRIIVLQDGKIAEQGTHDELMMNDGLYAQMYLLQKDEYQ